MNTDRKIAILSCGTEIILGRITDTNSTFIAERLSKAGHTVNEMRTVGDSHESLVKSIKDLTLTHNVVIISGGLGPTRDDLVRGALASVGEVPLVESSKHLLQIEEIFASNNWVMSPANRLQALLPEGAEGIQNHKGTAPGISMRIGNCDLYALPGVPEEMKFMFEKSVLTALSGNQARRSLSHEIHTFGIGESRLGEIIDDLMSQGRNPSVGTMVNNCLITIRITADGRDEQIAKKLLEQDRNEIKKRLAEYVYSEGDTSLTKAILNLLTKKGLTLSTAESCTGGLIAKKITDSPGASSAFLEGFVNYTNKSKINRLGVPASLLSNFGAVSREVAEAMAEGARASAKTDFSVSTTGIAGPGGGTEEKPVGLVYIAVSGPEGTVSCKNNFPFDRNTNRERASNLALGMLWRILQFGIEKKDS